MRTKKGAIQLSVSFIVIIIISLVVLAMGIYLIKLFVGEAREIKKGLDIETEKQIFDLLSGGDRVAFPINRKTIAAGHGDFFGLGILNILGEETVFDITLSKGIFIEKGKTEGSEWPDGTVPGFLATRSREIENNEQVVVSIPVNAPRGTKSGTYVIDVEVQPYDEVHKLYLVVP